MAKTAPTNPGNSKPKPHLEPYRFKKGQSGNPSGRPKKVKSLEDTATSHADAALEKLVSLMGSSDERVALAAAQGVLDRAVGKPRQTVSNEVTRKRDVADIDDAELAAIASSRSARTPSPQDVAEEPDSFH